MFEFHGWAVLNASSGQGVFTPKGLFHPDDEDLLRDFTRTLESQGDFAKMHVRLSQTINGLSSVALHGLRNHRVREVFEIFEWLAVHATRSYGVLMTRNDEDQDRIYDSAAAFRVYRLAVGTFTEMDSLFAVPQNPPRPESIWKDTD